MKKNLTNEDLNRMEERLADYAELNLDLLSDRERSRIQAICRGLIDTLEAHDRVIPAFEGTA